MPSDPALTVVNGGLPWWVWAAPAAALAAAALILGLGRRSRRGDVVPELAGVPLEITGLTKRFRDGQLAVDDLSLRVERGQILGLLRAQRGGQDHHAARPDGAWCARRPGRSRSSAAGCMPGRPRCPASARSSRARASCRTCPGGPTSTCTGGRPGRPADGAHLAEVLEVAGLGAADRPPGPRLLARHVPAARHRPGHARPAGPAGARRADERPGPAADQGDARRPAAVRGRRADRHPVQPPARRGRADLHARGRHARGPPARGRAGRGDHRRGRRAHGRDTRAGARRRRPARDGRDRRRRAAPGRGARPPRRRAAFGRGGRRWSRRACRWNGSARAAGWRTPSWH